MPTFSSSGYALPVAESMNMRWLAMSSASDVVKLCTDDFAKNNPTTTKSPATTVAAFHSFLPPGIGNRLYAAAYQKSRPTHQPLSQDCSDNMPHALSLG